MVGNGLAHNAGVSTHKFPVLVVVCIIVDVVWVFINEVIVVDCIMFVDDFNTDRELVKVGVFVWL